MRKFDETRSAFGDPRSTRVARIAGWDVIVARWQHDSAEVPLRPDGTAHFVMGLSAGGSAQYIARGVQDRGNTSVGGLSLMPYDRASVLRIEASEALHVFVPAALLRQPIWSGNVDGARSHTLRRYVLEIFVALHQQDPNDGLRLDLGVFALAQALQSGSKHDSVSTASGGLAPAVKRRIDELIASRMGADAVPPLNLTNMAGVARLGVDHFARMFRQETSMSPYRYALRRRLDRAMELLTRPQMSIADAAEQAGFCSPSHFIATFRAHLGVTPGAFRNAIRA